MGLRIVRRAAAPLGVALGAELHPVLTRVYAARGVRSAAELDHSLERLLPVGAGGARAGVWTCCSSTAGADPRDR
jgi:hypothetical protein